MKYTANLNHKDFPKSCGLNKAQETRLLNAINKAFDAVEKDFSIDEINEKVAPYIKTIEEAFYAGQTIISVVWASQNNKNQVSNNPNIN